MNELLKPQKMVIFSKFNETSSFFRDKLNKITYFRLKTILTNLMLFFCNVFWVLSKILLVLGVNPHGIYHVWQKYFSLAEIQSYSEKFIK